MQILEYDKQWLFFGLAKNEAFDAVEGPDKPSAEFSDAPAVQLCREQLRSFLRRSASG